MLIRCLFSVLVEERDKLATIAPNLPARLKENIEINPASGSIRPQNEKTVQVDFSRCFSLFYFSQIKILKIESSCLSNSKIGKSVKIKFCSPQVIFLPKDEITLKKCPILYCHLLDTSKRADVVAKIPLTVSLISYYTR